jgi:hypothetical protein
MFRGFRPGTVGEAIEEQRSLALVRPPEPGAAVQRNRRATETFEARDIIGPWRVPREGKRDCHQPLTFHPDGRWDSPSGGAEGRWSLEGNVLTLQTATDRISLNLLKTDGSNLDITNAQGRPLKLSAHTNNLRGP